MLWFHFAANNNEFPLISLQSISAKITHDLHQMQFRSPDQMLSLMPEIKPHGKGPGIRTQLFPLTQMKGHRHPAYLVDQIGFY